MKFISDQAVTKPGFDLTYACNNITSGTTSSTTTTPTTSTSMSTISTITTPPSGDCGKNGYYMTHYLATAFQWIKLFKKL